MRVQGLGVSGLGFRVWGSGIEVCLEVDVDTQLAHAHLPPLRLYHAWLPNHLEVR